MPHTASSRPVQTCGSEALGAALQGRLVAARIWDSCAKGLGLLLPSPEGGVLGSAVTRWVLTLTACLSTQWPWSLGSEFGSSLFTPRLPSFHTHRESAQHSPPTQNLRHEPP